MQDMSANPFWVVLVITALWAGVTEGYETASSSAAGFNKCDSGQREKSVLHSSKLNSNLFWQFYKAAFSLKDYSAHFYPYFKSN